MKRFSYKELERILNKNPFGFDVKYKWRHSMPMGIIQEKNNMVVFEINGKEETMDYLTAFGTYALDASFQFGYNNQHQENADKYFWFKKELQKYINSLGKQ